MKGIIHDIIEILRAHGLLKGGRLLLSRINRRVSHSFLLGIDVCQAFWSWRKFYLESRRSGRKLICITLTEHMGDIVACEPVARYVRTQERCALILWCVKGSYLEIVRCIEGLDGVIVVRCLSSWLALRRWAHFDRIVDLHINGRTCQCCQIPLRKKEGDLRITMENYYDYGSLLKSFCLSAGLPALSGQPTLNIPDRVVRRVDAHSLNNRTVVIHCCSNESCRDWPSSRWNELIKAMNMRYNVTVVEIGTQSPLNRIDSPGYRNLCGKGSILESAEIIRRALLFIGVDSGPAHLANAVGTFGIVLLGQYLSFGHYTPYSGSYADGSRAVLLRSNAEASQISVAEVLETIDNRRPQIFGEKQSPLLA